MEIKYICWERRKPVYTNYYLEPSERRLLVEEAGVHGLVLFEYYLYMAKQVEANELNDERAADWFGWTKSTAKRHRLALIKTGWLHIEKTKGKNTSATLYYLGKKAVAEVLGKSE